MTDTNRQMDGKEAFKNFHRSLCARFGYFHDEKNWARDLVSLEEWIVKKNQQTLESVFDEAVAEELKKITAIPFNSHDICEHFAKNLRERLFPAAQAPKKLTAEQLLHLKEIHVGPVNASDTKHPLTDADWVAFGMAVQDAQANL